MSPFSAFRASLAQALEPVLQECSQPQEVPYERMLELVEGVMSACGRGEEGEASWRTDVRRGTVDRVLEDALIKTALERPESETTFEPLKNVLDLILTFSEQSYCDSALPLLCLGNVLELSTIATCQRLFDYLDLRRDRITKDMLPQRGKGPLLLRMLNELLRRLPKSKPEHVVFSGRILMFLSSVFPLGEKSGVNLRGNFNTTKETLFGDVLESVGASPKGEGEEDDKMQDAPEDFYTTFWSLQRFFTNPPLLFAPTPVPSTSSTPIPSEPFAALRHGLTKTLDEFASATKKERELSGKAAKEGKKKTVESAAREVVKGLEQSGEEMDHYFFPKFLTSRNLLELELADPAFRRQILVQSLILFEYLLACTPAARAAVQPTTTNSSALSPFVLSPENESWIVEIKARALTELGKMDGGSRFSETVRLILSRDQNWIAWKLQACVPFEKAGIDPAEASDKARSGLAQVTRKPKPFPYKLGNPTLSRLWEKNLTSLDEFNPPQAPETLDALLRKWSMSNRALNAKRKQLSSLPAGNAQAESLRAQVEQLDIKAKALHWRATREAARSHLHLFAKIKAGDLDMLMALMDDERRRGEEEEERRKAELVGEELKMEESAPGEEKEESEVLLGTGGHTPVPAEVKQEDEPMEETNETSKEAGGKPHPATPSTAQEGAEMTDQSTGSTPLPDDPTAQVARPLQAEAVSKTGPTTLAPPSTGSAAGGAVPDEVKALMRGHSPRAETPTTPKRRRESESQEGEGEGEKKKPKMELDGDGA